ncbi:ClpX C4-type zinc finger protein [Arthrobacter tumbae]|uniref:ClpX C4-type zinc finger protein n=1 Tax=Arthrobacter tumbae TaxID=163874 RepID=UPI001957B41F
MTTTSEKVEPSFCDFCASPKSDGKRLIAGPGIAICESCISAASDLLGKSSGISANAQIEPRWEVMNDEELLSHLPEIAAVADRVEERLQQWVGAARSRGLSWARIGSSLDISRQSAWERFSGR